jgi:transcriptional regulator with XRE-family HTH domain
MKNWQFYRALHGRGVRLSDLAEALGTTHSHLSEVFNGKRGAHTRKHIARHLTPEELTALGWTARGELVPQGTLSHALAGGELENNNHQNP